MRIEFLSGREIAQGLMREVGVVALSPGGYGDLEIEVIVPVVGPDNVLLDGAHHTLGIGVALGVGPGGEDMLDAEGGAGLHEALRGLCRT